jgi:hypothetical protein
MPDAYQNFAARIIEYDSQLKAGEPMVTTVTSPLIAVRERVPRESDPV